MELKRITLPPINAPGDVTTFYSYESGAARSVALSSTAVALAGRNNGTTPVLMIDWDTEAPGLHHHFGRHDVHDTHDGLVEYFQACRDYLNALGRPRASADDSALARQVLEAVDWERYAERVDDSRSLYLMRAGRLDDTYGERAGQMDWDGLFNACPALFRCFGEHLAHRFRHVLIDARSGRSAATSICTTLLPSKLVAVFTPGQRSLEGVAGAVTRAIDYRCSNEYAQQPLLIYPLPSCMDSADCERRALWRRGDPCHDLPGYQSAIEVLLRHSYGRPDLSLDSYFDEVQLQHTSAIGGGEYLALAARRDQDRFSLSRTVESLLEWLEPGRFPWQPLAEVRLCAAIDAGRGLANHASDSAVAVPLAGNLHQLGLVHAQQRRYPQAIECFEESQTLRQRLLGDEHRDTRASRAGLAAALRESGKLKEAGFLHEQLYEDCYRLLGADHPETLAARTALASTLSTLGEYERALALHEQIVVSAERLNGVTSTLTHDSLAGRARTLASSGELGRARMVYERVLEGRERLLGSAHPATLQCASELAVVLSDMGDHHHACKLQQDVVAARERHLGRDHGLTLAAQAQLADTLRRQSDGGAVREVLQALSAGRQRALGDDHPDTLSSQLQLAAALGESGDHDGARRLQQHVVALQEKMRGSDDRLTLEGKTALAATLAQQGHSEDARRLHTAVLAGAARVDGKRGLASAAHDSHAGIGRLRRAVDPDADSVGQADMLGYKLQQLQQLIDNRSEREARELADSLRKTVLKPSASHPLRLQGVELIKQVYLRDNDKDALLSFVQDQVSALQEALQEAAGGRPMSTL